MKIIDPGFTILNELNGELILKNIERCGRICYKSEERITEDSAIRFVSMIINSGHESVLEHEKLSVIVICDRGVSHEIVRHRIASYSQESTRYCNYYSDKFCNELTFIKPYYWHEESPEFIEWKNMMQIIENTYMKLIEMGALPQEARSVLPNSLKTELVMTMNLREWRHFFRLRTSDKAHPQMQQIARPILDYFKKYIPIVFDDISYISV